MNKTIPDTTVILTGENPFIELKAEKDGKATTNSSFWRLLFTPAGAGHVLWLTSELTGDQWKCYSDNLAMTRWLQRTVQGRLNKELLDDSMPVTEATFEKVNNMPHYYSEIIKSRDEEIVMTWSEIGAPNLLNMTPRVPKMIYGVSSTLIPAKEARLTVNGKAAKGKCWPAEAAPFGTSCLAFSETWVVAESEAAKAKL